MKCGGYRKWLATGSKKEIIGVLKFLLAKNCYCVTTAQSLCGLIIVTIQFSEKHNEKSSRFRTK